MKALQLFTDESIERGRQMSSDEILKFLEEFRLMHARNNPSTHDAFNDDKPKKTILNKITA